MLLRLSIAFIALASLTASCAPAKVVWESKPPLQEAVNKQFSVTLEPLREGHDYFSIFRISVKNNTSADMEIDWNKTRYIHNGRPVSGFAFRGIDPGNLKDGTIPLDTVPAGSTFRKEIAPVKLITWQTLRDSAKSTQTGFNAGMIPPGENGALLVLRQGGKELQQEVSVRITEE
jgi:hypothetical protein